MLMGQSPGTCLSGIEWYTQQAHRAVNQAVGRVIVTRMTMGPSSCLTLDLETQRIRWTQQVGSNQGLARRKIWNCCQWASQILS
jgi:hypothetical protein